MTRAVRGEPEIFRDLETLCTSSGYAHVIAYFCARDNTLWYSGDTMTEEDVSEQFGMDRLVRTEISTLIGLACKGELDLTRPRPQIMQQYIDRTESLLEEIHQSMLPKPEDLVKKSDGENLDFSFLKSGSMVRESVFYGGESAYDFQYRDLSFIKYQKDNQWLKENKGYSIDDAISIVSSITHIQVEKINNNLDRITKTHPDEWSFLESYRFSIKEICDKSNIDEDVVRKFVTSFVYDEEVYEFEALDDFNPKNAYPIIGFNQDEYILFQSYSLVEALYETPFFWFLEDGGYRPKAMKNRGDFTEEFSAKRLADVFGCDRVHQNVNIIDKGGNIAGEIDVLVIFANRAIVLQAKSKKLTIASRKGNDLSLRDDFKKAVQDAYDQALSCSSMLSEGGYRLVDESGSEVAIKRSFKEIYPFCVVSDHYPSLSFQSRQFLKYKVTDLIQAPIVMDVFFLDVLTEMLSSPLYFLSYINRRSGYSKKVFSSQELTILAYHLQQNLYMDDEHSNYTLGDDISASLDLAMLTRRENAPGVAIPEGILTRLVGTTLGNIISQIELKEEPATIDLGFLLLLLNGDTVNQLNEGIDHICKLSVQDKASHDVTVAFGSGESGLTIHANYDDIASASERLHNHVEYRKYSTKANSWFGVCLNPDSKGLRFGLEVDYEWKQSDSLDEIVARAPKPQPRINIGTKVSGWKVGRNEKCPCGSGKKYKKCCI